VTKTPCTRCSDEHVVKFGKYKQVEKIPHTSDEGIRVVNRKSEMENTVLSNNASTFPGLAHWSLDVRVLSTLALTDSVAVGILCNAGMISLSLTVTVVVLASLTTRTVSPELR
jgi:hypothetical protein